MFRLSFSPWRVALAVGLAALSWYCGDPAIGLSVVGTLIARLGPGDLLSEGNLGNRAASHLLPLGPQGATLLLSSTLFGMPLHKVQKGSLLLQGYLGVCKIPTGATMTTGITVYISTTDDGAFSTDLGLAGVVTVSVRKIQAATAINTYGTASSATITMAATTGTFVTTGIAVTNANMNGAGAGDTMLIRIARNGASASDTCVGSVMLAPCVTIEST